MHQPSGTVAKITFFSRIFTAYTVNTSTLGKEGSTLRIATKTLTSLLVVTAVATRLPRRHGGASHKSQFDRLLQRHDRKAELRAEVLGTDPLTFRSLQKKYPVEQLVRLFGFQDVRAYRLALHGKIKAELRARGWSSHRIEQFVISRSPRLG